MQHIEHAAFVSVGRASGFAGFAIVWLMIGLSFDPAFSLKCGAGLSLGLSLVLYARAGSALQRSYRRTEAWLMLKNTQYRPPVRIAQQTIGQALREAYRWFARFSAFAAAGLSFCAILLGIVL